MVRLQLAGVSVDFPKNPYDVQKTFMLATINALNNKHNALLESPTGTGKTLCLLCATLAWQEHSMKGVQRSDTASSSSSGDTALAYNDGPNVSAEQQQAAISASLFALPYANIACAAAPGGAPKIKRAPLIIYASRTHTQLKQVVRELRSTVYLPEMTVMGSRDQLCINDRVSRKLKGSALIHACNKATSAHSCKFKNNLDQITAGKGTGKQKHRGNGWLDGVDRKSKVMDIEDLVRRGKAEEVCPYFHTRTAAQDAQILLVPYNYLLDATIRKTLDVDWDGSIVIFDEAHNLEQVACDAVSVSLTSADLAACIEELQQTLKELKNREANKSLSEGLASEDKRIPDKYYVVKLLKMLFSVEQRLDQVSLSASGPGNTPSAVMPGMWMDEMLRQVGFAPGVKVTDLECMKMICEFVMSCAQEKAAGGGGGAGVSNVAPKLEKFMRLIEKSLRNPGVTHGHGEDYKVFICEEEEAKKDYGYNRAQQASHSSGRSGTKKWVLNYWGFSPGTALLELKAVGVRQVLLASGTLSPMAAFRADLKLPFPVELQSPHVIELKKQVWVGAIGVGPGGKQLSSSYAVRESDVYKDELGVSILLILQAMLGRGGEGGVPGGPPLDGGVLVFFTSYKALSDCQTRWQRTGMWEMLDRIGGSVIIEPSGASSSKKRTSASVSSSSSPSLGGKSWGKGKSASPAKSKTAFGFEVGDRSKDRDRDRDNDNDDLDRDDDEIKNFIDDFEAAVKNDGKCVLLSVCRGKASEGIDFSDNKGRVAIMTGIPFAPINDAWVVLKKQYMDENSVVTTPAAVTNVPPCLPVVAAPKIGGWATAVSVIGGNGIAPVVDVHAPVAPPDKWAFQRTLPIQRSSSTERKLPTLSGQQWYTQAACRAVNQALGRIIRHKGDWGAIFLLDGRFSHGKQKDQLSHWVRPVHQSFSAFQQGLASFRDFATSALQNPLLCPRDSAEKEKIKELKIDEEELKLLNQRLNPKVVVPLVQVNNKVYISESIQEDGASYIDPELLLKASRVPPSDRPQVSSSSGSGFRSTTKDIDDIDFSQAAPSSKCDTSSKTTSAVNVERKQKPSLFSSASISRSNSQKAVDDATDDLAHLRDVAARGSGVTVSKNLFGKAKLGGGLSLGVSTSSGSGPVKRTSGLSSGGFSNAIQQIPKSQLAIVKPEKADYGDSIENGSAAREAAAAVVSNLDKEEKKNAMTRAFTEAKPDMPKAAWNGMTNLIRDAKKTHLKSEKLVQEFINKCITLLLEETKMLSRNIEMLLLSFQHLTETPALQLMYVTSVQHKCRLPKEGEKRALSKNAVAMNKRSWEEIESLEMAKSTSSGDGRNPGKLSKYTCPICKEQALDPCAAKCGHICCKECWSRWMAVKQNCPQCKLSVLAAELIAIHFSK